MAPVPDNRRVALVTDVTSGVGPAMVRNLCQTFKGIVYAATSSPRAGKEFADSFQKDGLSPRVKLLDLASIQQLESFAQFVIKEHGGLDILVANARTEFPKSTNVSYHEAGEILAQNVINQQNLLQCLLPVMKAHGRIVLVATQPGVHYALQLIREKHEDVVPTFGVEVPTMERLHAGLKGYLTSVALGAPWSSQPDAVICLGLQFLASIVTRQLALRHDIRNLLINVGSPGWRLSPDGKTFLDDKGFFKGEVGVEEDTAAANLLWLARLSRGAREPSGEVVKNRKVVEWRQ